MITKYTEYIKENLSSKTEIKNWLDSMNIKKYTINKDLTVDVDGYVNISIKKLKKIPVKFNIVYGHFDCSFNELTSLKGCPTIVMGNFYCYENNLTNLNGCPTTINGDFSCHTNHLTNLNDCPTIINGHFACSHNNLTNLNGCPTTIKGILNITDNPLEDINDLDSKILIENIEYIRVSKEVFDKYFEYWINKDSNILSVLKDKVSDTIKQKYIHLFQANNFNLL